MHPQGLLEDGEVLLADGRRFVTPRSPLFEAAAATAESNSDENKESRGPLLRRTLLFV